MRVTIKFKDGFTQDEFTNDTYYDVVREIGVDIGEVPQLATALNREEIIKNIVHYGKADSVIDGMYSIDGISMALGCKWIISIGRASDVKYEDVVNSGYHFRYFTITDGTVYVLFSSVEDL